MATSRRSAAFRRASTASFLRSENAPDRRERAPAFRTEGREACGVLGRGERVLEVAPPFEMSRLGRRDLPRLRERLSTLREERGALARPGPSTRGNARESRSPPARGATGRRRSSRRSSSPRRRRRAARPSRPRGRTPRRRRARACARAGRCPGTWRATGCTARDRPRTRGASEEPAREARRPPARGARRGPPRCPRGSTRASGQRSSAACARASGSLQRGILRRPFARLRRSASASWSDANRSGSRASETRAACSTSCSPAASRAAGVARDRESLPRRRDRVRDESLGACCASRRTLEERRVAPGGRVRPARAARSASDA